MRCRQCSAEIPPGQTICPQCGTAVDFDPSSTVAIRSNLLRLKRPRSVPEGAPVTPDEGITLHIRGLKRYLCSAELKNLVLGRADPENAVYPGLDLTPYGAEQRGVSRRHVSLNYAGGILTVRDLRSANGTWLNGQQLQPQRPYPVNDGDELILGQLAIGIRYGR